MNDFVDAIQFIARDGVNQPGDPTLIHLTLKHLEVCGRAMAVACAIALPIGVWLGHLHRGSFMAINVANIGRALPSLAVIAIGVAFIGLGFWNVARRPRRPGRPADADQRLRREWPASTRTSSTPPAGWGCASARSSSGSSCPSPCRSIFAGDPRSPRCSSSRPRTIASLAGYSGTLGDIIANQASYRAVRRARRRDLRGRAGAGRRRRLRAAAAGADPARARRLAAAPALLPVRRRLAACRRRR